MSQQPDDKLEQIRNGYVDAKSTLGREASYEEHQIAREWLRSTYGQQAKMLVEQEMGLTVGTGTE